MSKQETALKQAEKHPADDPKQETTPQATTAATSRPAWPPPPRPRKKSHPILKIISSVSILILCFTLLFGSIGLLLLHTTTHYKGALRHIATVEVKETRSVAGTAQAQAQATSQYINTAQANIEATATAQGIATSLATQTINDGTATAAASTDLFQTLTTGTPTISDPLTDKNGKNKWDIGGPDSHTGCAFDNTVYHATEAQQTYLQPCIAQGTDINNFIYQAEVTILKGDLGQAGLLFRSDTSGTAYYFFHVDSSGDYALDLYNTGNQISTLLQGTSSVIQQGFNQMNQLQIIATSSSITILANNTYLGTIADNTLTQGKIGVGVIDNSTPIDATFANVRVWNYTGN
ncbi:hypothetical protein [Dictyobacter arantiisoli]|uniref:3-keto-disaccharide hydrolase domain-containing protein n=1 Tax=Dictyobacter arantiisoli TaxID=2014874 RepID=A0A5A5T9G6_9CHLR|nr:hypothetical protein [Dictyobacter arantiisoli]GCF08140.1 hypothetical protein KDI_17040 [Dictyobacter arantiisoli]